MQLAPGQIGRIKNMEGHPLQGKRVQIVQVLEDEESGIIQARLLEAASSAWPVTDIVDLQPYEFEPDPV